MRDFKIAEPQTIGQVTSLAIQKKDMYYLMAGGTDLLAEIKDEIIEPAVVVDLRSIPDLSYIKKEKNEVRIGAMTSLTRLAEDPLIKNEFPALHEAANSVATPQLRNMGTAGGNLCQKPRCWYYRDPQVKCRKKGGSRCFAFKGKNKYHAILGGGLCYIVHPSDLAPALIALDAEISISSAKGDKTIPLENFYTLPKADVRKENILEQNEILREIKIPLTKKGEKSTYHKLKERESWDFGIVSAAVKGTVSGGAFRDIKIVLGGVAPIPWRLTKAENLIKGKKVTEDQVRKAAREALKEAKPLEENRYKKELVEAILTRAALSLV
jgi:xanthine dehydrogenase YagS FAD-binding subunit